MNRTQRFGLLLAAVFFTNIALGAEPDAARVAQIAAWLPASPQGVAPSIADRAAWRQLAGRPEFADVVENAARLAREPLPELPDDLFLDYSRTGNRDHWQKVAFARRARVQTFVLAECLEDKGRFIAPLEETITALCAEKTWVYPAHDGSLKNFHGRITEIDLGSSTLGGELALADRLLAGKLSPATHALIQTNLERRIFTPFRAAVRGTGPQFWWLTGRNNWNAVCLAGVTGAALSALSSPADRAWFIAAAERYVRNFLGGFTPDGYCSEGVGYWNYGFGNFTTLAETIRRDTGGKVDLLAEPAALRPAQFGARTEILAGIYPSIADCSPGTHPDEKLMAFLARRFGFAVPDYAKSNGDRPSSVLAQTLMYATAPDDLPHIGAAADAAELAWRTWFPDGGVLICRPGPTNPAPFAACLKGGNNNENHNHNDVGTFMVVAGKTMVICDPGGEVYTKRTFGPHRYDSKVLNSFGHAVPVVAGQLQRPGAAARGVVLHSRFTPAADELKLDIRSAYAVPELTRLEREFVFRRGAAPELTVSDSIAFSRPETYESALITWGDWKQVGSDEILITDGHDGVRVRIDTGGVPVKISSETIDEDVHTRRQPVRIGIRLTAPVTRAEFKLRITPAQ